MQMNTAPVMLKNVVTRFGNHIVHDGVDLSVGKGEIVALIGGSGSGKTTLLRHIIGLTHPDSGEVRLFGESLFEGTYRERQIRRQRLGVLFQQGALFSAMTVAENIMFPLKELRIATAEELRTLVQIKLDMVGLEAQHAALMPAELSGGMVKRVALARALSLEPELLLLDEPTSGLDPDLSASFVNLIRDLHQMLGLTVILVTHDVDTLCALATHVAVLADKQIISYASLSETLKNRHPFIQRFFYAYVTESEHRQSERN